MHSKSRAVAIIRINGEEHPSPVMKISSVVKAGDSKEAEFREIMVSA